MKHGLLWLGKKTFLTVVIFIFEFSQSWEGLSFVWIIMTKEKQAEN